MDNCDIPRCRSEKGTFIEEVTQAQLDAEAKLAEETATEKSLKIA